MEGKVTGIAKFGAFVSLEEGKSGLVHISEISAGFVTDINEHLKVGDVVKVKIVSVDEKGRINLSIRQAQPKPEEPRRPAPKNEYTRPSVPDFAPEPKAPASFEDMLLNTLGAFLGVLLFKRYINRIPENTAQKINLWTVRIGAPAAALAYVNVIVAMALYFS